MINRLLFITSLLLFTASQIAAQQYTYIYDAAGNRTLVTLYKSSLASQDSAAFTKPFEVVEQNRVFKLYPNPTKGNVTIECSGLKEDTKVTCIIRDAAGGFVSNAENTGQQSIQFNIGSYPNGMYFFQLTLPDGQYVLKVLKE